MKPKIFLPLLLSFLILNSSLLISTVRYVSPTGSSTPPYTTWETAADSIMECINISVFGDTIYVANGTYIEKVTMIHGLTMIGAGIDSCIIDTRTISQQTNYNAVTMKDECVIEGFNIIVRNNLSGTTAIHSLPEPTDSLYFQGKVINNKISMAGDGISSSNAFLTIKNNIIIDVDTGIDVFGLDTSVLDTIYNNYLFQIKSAGIVTDLGGRGIIFNNFVQMSNVLSFGIGIASTGISQIFNNLITGSNQTDGIILNTLPCDVYNNVVDNCGEGLRFSELEILRNNLVLDAQYGYHYFGESSDNVEYNNAWNCDYGYYNFTPESTNLEINPMLVNEDSLDFHLQQYSPLVDAGDKNILDKDGTRSDIGLYGGPYGEKYTYRDLAPKPPSNLTAVMDSGLVKLTWNKNTEADFYHYRVYRDTVPDFMYDTTKIIAVLSDTVYFDDPPQKFISGNYYYKITALDNTEHQSTPSEEVHINITGIPEASPVVIDHYQLLNNYPNPFNPSTKIPYRLIKPGYVKLYVYDIKGEVVKLLVNGYQNSGYYEVEFKPNQVERERGKLSGEGFATGYNDDIATGIYIYQIMVRGEGDIPVFTDMGKMILLK